VSTVEHYMPMIFTIILLLGYLGVVMMYAKEIEHI